MKNLVKYFAVITSTTLAVLGILYVLKNYIIKDEDSDDFADFDDDFDYDFDDLDDADDAREYVTLNMPNEDEKADDSSKKTEKEESKDE